MRKNILHYEEMCNLEAKGVIVKDLPSDAAEVKGSRDQIYNSTVVFLAANPGI